MDGRKTRVVVGSLVVGVLIGLAAAAVYLKVKNAKEGDDNDGLTSLPESVSRLVDGANWYIDTLCVVNGEPYCYAVDEYARTSIIFNRQNLIVENPMIKYYRKSPSDDSQYYIYVADQCYLVDFAQSETLAPLIYLMLPKMKYYRTRENLSSDCPARVVFNLEVDLPLPNQPHAQDIVSWLVDKIDKSQNLMSDQSATSQYDGYVKRCYDNWLHQGKMRDGEALARFAADRYFNIIEYEYEYEKNKREYPFCLFLTQSWRVDQMDPMNAHYVTYQKYVHEYYGGAHGDIIEEMISYDYSHRQEIDWEYLFKPGSKEKVLDAFFKVVANDPHFTCCSPGKVKDDVRRFFNIASDEEDPEGSKSLPQPALGRDGVVFSFQPYEIDCFASGAYHFVIPYREIRSCLTEKALWCIESKTTICFPVDDI